MTYYNVNDKTAKINNKSNHKGWLEPLIDPIARNKNVSTVPLIEIIDDNTFQLYSTAIESIQVGGFDWNLIFDWHPVPRNEMERRKKKTDPIRSPTMAGMHPSNMIPFVCSRI